MDNLILGIVLTAVLVVFLNYILKKSEENVKRQDEEYDKAWNEYQEYLEKQNNTQL